MKARLPGWTESPSHALAQYVSAHPGDAAQYSVLSRLVCGVRDLVSLPLIPKLVALYQWLYAELNGRITWTEAANITMQSVFSAAGAAS